MKQDKWIKELHDKLAEHEMAAPEGLWDKIEAALEEQPASPQPASRKSRFVAFLQPLGKHRRWAVAASLAALLAGGGYLAAPLLSPQQEESTDVELLVQSSAPLSSEGANSTPATSRPSKQEEANNSTTTPRPKETGVGEKRVDAAPTLLAEAKDIAETTAESYEHINDVSTDLAQTDFSSAASSDMQSAEGKESSLDLLSPTADTSQKALYPSKAEYRSKPESRNGNPHLSLYAMNSLGSQTNSNGVLMADHLARQFNGIYEQSQASLARSNEPIYLSGYEERQHHYYPVSYGLTLSYPLSTRLSLSTGIVYTRLTSDFTQVMRSQQIQQQQTLHYVGVPLGLSYEVWQYKRFRTYLSLWGKTDWNVDTRLETEGVNQESPRDRLQWSLGSSMGVQLDVVPQLGLYAEPGLGWYPDNGSKIQNYFKDKPLNLNLQVGLRLNLGQF